MSFAFPQIRIMRYLLSAFLFVCLISSCVNKAQDDPNETTAPPSQMPAIEGITTTTTVIDELTGQPVLGSKPIKSLSTAIGENPLKIEDPIPPKLVAPNPQTAQEQRVVRVLTTEYWSVWALVRIKDVPANRINQGAWFKFETDGTYKYGFWDETISTGTWTFDGTNALLNLDSKLKGDDREWRIQMGSDEDVMVWIGTEKYNTPDIQLKLMRFFNIPKTRAELGVTE